MISCQKLVMICGWGVKANDDDNDDDDDDDDDDDAQICRARPK